MYKKHHITAVIPALNEAKSVNIVVEDLLRVKQSSHCVIDRVIVCDNGSTDETALTARMAGADVVFEQHRGYGAACLAALAEIGKEPSTDIILFLNADQSEDVAELISLLDPITDEHYDLVVGSRAVQLQQNGALSPLQTLGNNLVSALVRWFWDFPCTDFGPFRAIRFESLESLHMRDRNYGWTVEMQVKALYHGLQVLEVPVSARRGKTASRISGTSRGIIGAAAKMLGWVLVIAALGAWRKTVQRFVISQRQTIS